MRKTDHLQKKHLIFFIPVWRFQYFRHLLQNLNLKLMSSLPNNHYWAYNFLIPWALAVGMLHFCNNKQLTICLNHEQGSRRGCVQSGTNVTIGPFFLWVRDVLHPYFAHTSKFLASKTILIWPGCEWALVFHGKPENKSRRRKTL